MRRTRRMAGRMRRKETRRRGRKRRRRGGGGEEEENNNEDDKDDDCVCHSVNRISNCSHISFLARTSLLSKVIPQTLINMLLTLTFRLENLLVRTVFNYSRRLLHTHACLTIPFWQFKSKKVLIFLTIFDIFILF